MGQITLPEEGSPLYLALNAAIGDQKMLQARQRFACAQGLLGADSKRPTAWRSFGWAETLSFQDYYRMWERGGLAHGAVNRTIAKCWQDDPEVIEGAPEETKRPPTAWEQEFKAFAKSSKLWECMREADLRRVVGKYSALILQIADGKTWNQPVRGRAARRLVKIIPAWEGQLTPSAWGQDETNSETYGLPTMFSFRENAVGNDANVASAGYAGRNLEIHPDRVIILGDIINGVPMLRAPYNDFVNIEKILGGSGESFLKNAARAISINFGEKSNLSDIAAQHKVSVSELRGVFDQVTEGLNRGVDQTLITQNADVKPLVAVVPDPQQHFNVSLQSAAASFMMPIMIWIGSQTGERSSQEDQKDWNKTNQGRRLYQLAGDIETVLAHLTRIGLVKPVAESSVVWSDLNEATQGEKLDNADKMAGINQKSMGTGEVPYSSQEIRDMSGHVNGEPVEIELDEGGDDGEEIPPKGDKKK